jgi:hypothetical protein
VPFFFESVIIVYLLKMASIEYSQRLATEKDHDLILEGIVDTYTIEQVQMPTDLTETHDRISTGISREQIVIVLHKEGSFQFPIISHRIHKCFITIILTSYRTCWISMVNSIRSDAIWCGIWLMGKQFCVG